MANTTALPPLSPNKLHFEHLWWLGVIFAFSSTVIGAVAKLLMRYSTMRKTKGWLFMSVALFLILIVAPLLDMSSYAFASQQTVAPIAGFVVVWNALLAPITLRETITPTRIGSCVLITIGVSCCALFGAHEEPHFTVEFMEKTFIRPRVLAYVVFLTCWLFFLIRWPMQARKGSLARGVSLGVIAGSLGGNLFCIKAVATCIREGTEKGFDSVFGHSILPYIMIAGAIFFSLGNVRFVYLALRECEALFIVPVFEGTMIVVSCFTSWVVLSEFTDFSAIHVILYIFSVLLIVLGMLILVIGEYHDRKKEVVGSGILVDSEENYTDIQQPFFDDESQDSEQGRTDNNEMENVLT
eukprot:g2500.t1